MAIPTKDDVEAAPEALLEGAYCTKVEDFFSPGSRDLIGRFLTNFTESLVITPTELVFSAKYQKRLNDAGRVMMNAVDKIATLQAKLKGESAAQRLRDLNTLISAGMKKLWDDEKDKPAPTVTAEGFSAYCATLKGSQVEKDYAANRALTELLFSHKVWKDKVSILVKMFGLTKGKDENRHIEQVLSECLKSDPALDQMLGLCETLEERCNDLADLWKGEWKQRDTAHAAMETIAAMINDGSAPNCKASVEYSLLRTLASKMPLRSAEPEIEITALFDLFKRMWTGTTLIGGAKALTSLERRQARHLNKEGVTDLLRERKVLSDRYAFLMQLSTITVGQGNRAMLKTFIDHYFGDKDFVPRVVTGQEPPVPKLQTLAGIHRTIKASWLPDGDKAAYMAQMEAAQIQLLKNSRLFDQIDKKGGGPAQKVLTLLDLCRKGTFIDGVNMEAVRQLLNTYIRDPGFMTDYLGTASGEEKERKMMLLTKTLASIGVTV
ncbi:cAMP-binding protein [Paramagnetospirillum magnetotacticum MS-1]|uniref:cAMP-binding protein n=1 Tax=Paramagnetospirillum magnetotacticum MS-1 TaxID=272627 RepID=A0A0C2YI19_PARME|nr:hypothetical protein [Paramagnetospirillum magnetotacticum]KIL99394.1 cAMP-binding protein [Paramagnetospirillum magnetotacticum MS-1]